MGNRNAHRSPVDLSARYWSADKARFRTATSGVDSYFQPPSVTLEEYLRSRPHPYHPEAVEEQPLRQLSYREAYDHLRDLADQQLRKANDALTEMSETVNFSVGNRNKRMSNGGNLTTTINREKNKRLHDWWTEQQGRSTLGNVRPINHGLPSGVGDSISPSSIHQPLDTDSEDTVVRYEEPVNKQHQMSVRYLETPCDTVAKTGDTRTTSLSSSNSDTENLIVKTPATQNKAQHFRKPHEVHVEEISSKSISLVRNLRTLQTPAAAENYYYIEKARNTIDRPSANIPACREPTQGADLRRSSTFVNHDPKLEMVALSPNKFNCHLGFHRLSDGRVTYTAYVHSGPSAVPIAGWLTDLQKRASRHLIGLRRQHRCDIHFDPHLIPYRGLYVHAMVIIGQTQSDLIRFRNSLPACIQKYMITPFANHSAALRRRGTFRNVS